MTILALILACLAALLHIYIFWLEAFAWTAPRGRATFGTSAAEAEATRELAYNQGFYNLFLAVMAGVGVVLVVLDRTHAGWALVLAGCGSMLAAALVLALSSADKRKAAASQGTVPLLAVVAAVLALV